MANLLKCLKADLLTARRERSKVIVNVLTPVIGDAQKAFLAKPRDYTFDEIPNECILEVIKSHINNANITLAASADNVDALQTINILSAYRSKQLTEGELQSIISEFMSTADYTGKGSVMKYLSANYKGTYDGKIASSIIDEMS